MKGLNEFYGNFGTPNLASGVSRNGGLNSEVRDRKWTGCPAEESGGSDTDSGVANVIRIKL